MDVRYVRLLIFVMAIFIMPLAIAIPAYEQETNITLSIPCTSDGDVCGGGTACTATIVNPESVTILNGETMNQNGAVFDVNISADQSTVLGQYEFSVSCCDGPRCFAKSLPFLITPSGAPPVSQGQGIIVVVILLILFGINIFIYVLGVRTTNGENGQNPILKIALLSLGVVMTLGIVLYGLVLLNETIGGSPVIIQGLETFFMVFRIVITILFLVLLFVVFSIVLKRFKIKRGMLDEDD